MIGCQPFIFVKKGRLSLAKFFRSNLFLVQNIRKIESHREKEKSVRYSVFTLFFSDSLLFIIVEEIIHLCLLFVILKKI